MRTKYQVSKEINIANKTVLKNTKDLPNKYDLRPPIDGNPSIYYKKS